MRIIEQDSKIYQEEIDFIVNSIKNKRTILFLGSGFTRNAKTTFGKTLMTGEELKQYFIDTLNQKDPDYNKEELSGKSFSTVAELYFDEINPKEIKDFFKTHFTNVILDELKIAFLDLNWRNIFTLNVDDAIENNTKYRNVIFPFQKITDDIEDYSPLVYKLHGDIKNQILHGEENIQENIIFSESSYLVSILGRNKDMLNAFLTNYKDFNCIFIGCSLQDEKDLKAIIAEHKYDLQKQNTSSLKRIYITSKDLSKVDQKELEKNFSITHVIKIADYNNFYKKLIQNFENNTEENQSFSWKKFSINNVNESSEDNIKFLLGNSIIDIESSTIKIPYFFIRRNIFNELIEEIDNNYIFLLKSNKVSGKTYFLADIYKSVQTYSMYFIPSSEEIDLTKFQEFIESLHNSFILLDSNSFSEKHIKYIAKNTESLKKKKVKILFTYNASEKMDIAYFTEVFENFHEISLPSCFNENETQNLNKKLDYLGLPRYDSKISIVKNIFKIEKNYADQTENKVLHNQLNNTPIDKTFLGAVLLILTFDKIYSSTFYLIYGSSEKFNKFIEHFSPFVEVYLTSNYEISKYSGQKAILICDSCLLYYLNNYFRNKSFDEISNEIFHIASKLIDTNQSTLVNQLILFSNLNALFNSGSNNFGGSVIFKTYEKLEGLLYENTDFWLQRATSYLYLSNINAGEIEKGIEYAKKAYLDFSHEKKKTQALHTLAMLYGRKANKENYQVPSTIKEAFNYYDKALAVNQWNRRYIAKIITRDIRTNDFYKLLKNAPKQSKLYEKMREDWLTKYYEHIRNF